MSMTMLKKKTGYALGMVLCVIGIIMLVLVLWKFWGAGVFESSAPLSEMSIQLWTEHADIALGVGLQLIHYFIVGVVLLVIGATILVVRREKIQVVEEVTTLVECPRCKNQWEEPLAKEQLKSMGYPKVRTLSRRKCSNCGKFIRPKIVAKRRKP